MPENAAAEGGYGLGANEAFGGQVGTGNISASAVGGAQGSFGGGGLGEGNPAAQAAAAQNAVSIASSIFGNTNTQMGLLSLAANLSANMNPASNAPAPSIGFDPEAAFGMTAPGLNPTTGGMLSGTMSPDTAPSIDPSGYAMADVTGVSGMTPADVAAIGTQVDVDAAMNRGGLQSGNFGPGLPGGTVSSANLAAGNMSTTGVPGGTGSVSTNAAGNISPAQASGIVSAIGPLSGGTGTNAAANAAAAAQMGTAPALGIDRGLAQAAAQAEVDRSVDAFGSMNQAAINSVASSYGLSPSEVQGMVNNSVAGLNATTAPSATGTNVTPGQIAQDASRSTTAPSTAPSTAQATGLRGLLGNLFSRNPGLPSYGDRGLIGKLGMDLAMGLSINPFGSRADQAASLAARGYSPAEIEGFFGRTDATVAQNAANAEMTSGARDSVSDEELKKYGQSLSKQKAIEFDRMTRQQQMQEYYRAKGY